MQNFRSFTDMCLDGPVDYEGELKTLTFKEPCIISSVQVMRQTGWDGKRFGNIRAVEFRNEPSAEDLQKAGVIKNPLQWKGSGYAYNYTADPRAINTLIKYLAQFDKEINQQMQAYLGSNYPKTDMEVSDSPTITVK